MAPRARRQPGGEPTGKPAAAAQGARAEVCTPEGLPASDGSAGASIRLSYPAKRKAVPLAWVEVGVIALGLLLRVALSVGPHSGQGVPPKFGDYEAQRHWMEITVNLPIHEWYVNTPDNDLRWWGLDYPPLSAYQSLVHGWMVRAVDPKTVSLHESRGREEPVGRAALRATVLLSDACVYLPSALWAARAAGSAARAASGGAAARAGGPSSAGAPRASARSLAVLAHLVLAPSLVLIDHGHFQYNCISLGLALSAAAAVLSSRPLVASFLFSLSLNHKQIALYFAPAFFAHLLGLSLRGEILGEGGRRGRRRRGDSDGAARRAVGPAASVVALGLVVLATFVALWAPFSFLRGAPGPRAVLARIFPVSRGVFEDYVSNFWCSSQPLFRWKERLAGAPGARVSASVVAVALLPTFFTQVAHPSPRGFLLSLLSSSLAFFSFGYQVHEKSILFPLAALSLLAGTEPVTAAWGAALGAASMLPLLERDGLGVAAPATVVACASGWALALAAAGWLDATGANAGGEGSDAAAEPPRQPTLPSASPTGGLPARTAASAGVLSALGTLGVLLLRLGVPAPARYPFAHDWLLSAWCFLHVGCLWLWSCRELLREATRERKRRRRRA